MIQDLRGLIWLLALLPIPGLLAAAEEPQPLAARIDALIAEAAQGQPASPLVDDAGFLRRIALDLTGAIPGADETLAFLDDPAPDKRSRLIDRLLESPDHARRMEEFFHVMFMERMGDNPRWSSFLRDSFAANKPWNQLVREILRGNADDQATQGAAFFYAKRLENYGQNPVDHPALTRDVGRLFLGIDLRCAQCHDHLFIDDYKQNDFQGLHTFFQNLALQDIKVPSIREKATTAKTSYTSVFTKVEKQTGPRVPGMTEIGLPELKPGEEYLAAPDPRKKIAGKPRFSLLEALAEQLPGDANPAFARNIVNRLWFAMMGRGLVHPLDQFHAGNPPSHPALLDLLAAEFRRHSYDGKWLLRTLALTQTYQRSGLVPRESDAQDEDEESTSERFLTAIEKRLSAEQLLRSMLVATGERERGRDAAAAAKQLAKGFDALKEKFVKAYANEPREPEDEFNPSLRAALFVQNDSAVLKLLEPRPGNLVDRLTNQADASLVAEELYVSILTRRPTADEQAEVADYLTRNTDRRSVAIEHLAWALLASAEFSVNH
jgi:hypothetical protein